MKSKDNQYYVAQAYMQVATAGSKPMKDFDQIVKGLGVSNIGIKQISVRKGKIWWLWNWASSYIAKLRMPKDSIIFLQYPCQYKVEQLLKEAKKRNNKIILLIHDIEVLRGSETGKTTLLQKADILIVHTKKMKLWVQENLGLNNVEILGIFDYLGEAINDGHEFNKNSVSIVFAGNLSKAPFLNQLKELKNRNCRFELYGPKPPEEITSSNIIYNGMCLPEDLGKKISKYDFGLVWDGDSINTCSGNYGNYMRYNSPYKISSYIAAGLPLILWSEMAMAEFVDSNKIGIIVNSLSELESRLDSLSSEEYIKMKQNVVALQNKICSGFFYKQAIEKALTHLSL